MNITLLGGWGAFSKGICRLHHRPSSAFARLHVCLCVSGHDSVTDRWRPWRTDDRKKGWVPEEGGGQESRMGEVWGAARGDDEELRHDPASRRNNSSVDYMMMVICMWQQLLGATCLHEDCVTAQSLTTDFFSAQRCFVSYLLWPLLDRGSIED